MDLSLEKEEGEEGGRKPPCKENLQVTGLLNHWVEQPEGTLHRCKYLTGHKPVLRMNIALPSWIKAMMREGGNIGASEKEIL